MEVVDQWTARHACALQAALRQTNEQFARHFLVTERTIAKWHADGSIVPKLEFQQCLDTLYAKAEPDARARFALLVEASEQPVQLLRVAIAVVLRGDEVLLTLRNGDDGITWGFVGAIVKPGQRPEAAALREVLDETGVHCRVERVLGERPHPVTGALCVYLECPWLAGEASNLDESENLSTMWVRRDQVTRFIPPGMIYPPILALLEGTAA